MDVKNFLRHQLDSSSLPPSPHELTPVTPRSPTAGTPSRKRDAAESRAGGNAAATSPADISHHHHQHHHPQQQQQQQQHQQTSPFLPGQTHSPTTHARVLPSSAVKAAKTQDPRMKKGKRIDGRSRSQHRSDPFAHLKTHHTSHSAFHQRQRSYDLAHGKSHSSSSWSLSSWDGPITRHDSTGDLYAEFSDLPPGWSVGKTPVGAIYFIDERRKTTTWLDPRTHRPYPGRPTQPGQSNASPAQADGLPAGWEMVLTPSGKPYFVDHVNKATTWEDPRSHHRPSSPSPPGGAGSSDVHSRIEQLRLERQRLTDQARMIDEALHREMHGASSSSPPPTATAPALAPDHHQHQHLHHHRHHHQQHQHHQHHQHLSSSSMDIDDEAKTHAGAAHQRHSSSSSSVLHAGPTPSFIGPPHCPSSHHRRHSHVFCEASTPTDASAHRAPSYSWSAMPSTQVPTRSAFPFNNDRFHHVSDDNPYVRASKSTKTTPPASVSAFASSSPSFNVMHQRIDETCGGNGGGDDDDSHAHVSPHADPNTTPSPVNTLRGNPRIIDVGADANDVLGDLDLLSPHHPDTANPAPAANTNATAGNSNSSSNSSRGGGNNNSSSHASANSSSNSIDNGNGNGGNSSSNHGSRHHDHHHEHEHGGDAAAQSKFDMLFGAGPDGDGDDIDMSILDELDRRDELLMSSDALPDLGASTSLDAFFAPSPDHALSMLH
ncbi:hypothetical protein PTSG_06057 [Salpingoeca rosetta]|uniref:WW domain-containing protein n=1 Tax=Salpingoeca rosetta (strain ATCC 50818 / BSB-021) TaxID=946362 RepID=F2UDK1_SALR5|nr:uncharacterized protein PTSG_06057 [Salpingoeca rosetta]EGD74696.1 hypothetical protein PTSG_06057 [Salpingoeca rosetta]|eukprot:XP_004992953.1 hypothetical protein PTSG_06057 [Salpingoeca rosetta]